MLDTHARKYVNPLINKVATIFLKLNMKANQVTFIAFLIGFSTSLFIYFDYPIVACIVLWFSGFLDAVDGTMARMEKNTTAWGTLMDITFDRIVEMGMIISLAIRFPNARLQLLILTACIVFSMTVFLTVGALSEKQGMKSFYYQAGIAERTEGFILFTLMILLPKWLIVITNLYSLLVFITGIQRMVEAKKLLL